MSTIYKINKGINQTIEFKGLKAQYIWYLGGGIIALMILFAALFIIGLPSLVCVGLIGILGTLLVMKVYALIDTAFRHVRLFTLVVVAVSAAVSLFALYRSFGTVDRLQDRIYVLADGKAIEAYASDRRDNIQVEGRDHIRNFHHFFFTLDPDEKVIRDNITKALYLADSSAKRAYDDLKESGYYAGIISGNITQGITIDSVTVDIASYPYTFRCYATQQIVRPTSILTRSLITAGSLRNVSRSDNNPHGFLIERWSTIDNRDLKTENRK